MWQHKSGAVSQATPDWNGYYLGHPDWRELPAPKPYESAFSSSPTPEPWVAPPIHPTSPEPTPYYGGNTSVVLDYPTHSYIPDSAQTPRAKALAEAFKAGAFNPAQHQSQMKFIALLAVVAITIFLGDQDIRKTLTIGFTLGIAAWGTLQAARFINLRLLLVAGFILYKVADFLHVMSLGF